MIKTTWWSSIQCQNEEERGFKCLSRWPCWCQTGQNFCAPPSPLWRILWKRGNIQRGNCRDENALLRHQRRIRWLGRNEEKATVTPITTAYIQGRQSSLSEHTTGRTLKKTGCSSNLYEHGGPSSSRRMHHIPSQWYLEHCSPVASIPARESSIQQSPFRLWWNNVDQNLRDGSSSLLKVHHEELRHFSRQKVITNVRSGRFKLELFFFSYVWLVTKWLGLFKNDKHHCCAWITHEWVTKRRWLMAWFLYCHLIPMRPSKINQK